MKTAILYVHFVKKGVGHVMDWYGTRVTKDMPIQFAHRYVARFGA